MGLVDERPTVSVFSKAPRPRLVKGLQRRIDPGVEVTAIGRGVDSCRPAPCASRTSFTSP